MPTKRAKIRRTVLKRKLIAAKTKKDVVAFVNHLHKDRSLRAKIRKGWEDVIKGGKKQGFVFTRQQLLDHLKKKYKLKRLPSGDEPDTCICIV